MLGLDRDQVFALGLVEVRRAFQGQVVGFGGAAGPDDFARVGVDQGGHLLAGGLDRLFSFPAPGMAARRRIAEVFTQPGNHGVHHPRIAGIGGAVVHVDGKVRSAHGGQ
ncbi:hypothetical protein D9M69_654400 [compost metagenome]